MVLKYALVVTTGLRLLVNVGIGVSLIGGRSGVRQSVVVEHVRLLIIGSLVAATFVIFLDTLEG